MEISKRRGKNIESRGFLLVITGPPASGKDTVLNELTKNKKLNLQRIVTYATREKRPGEIHGIDHYFVSEKKFHYLRKKGHLLEHVQTGTTWKGTPKAPFEKVITHNHRYIWRIDPFRVAHLDELFIKNLGESKGLNLYEKTASIFINVSDPNILKNRYTMRDPNFDLKQFEIRFKKDMKVWESLSHKFSYCVYNDNSIRETILNIRKYLNNRFALDI